MSPARASRRVAGSRAIHLTASILLVAAAAAGWVDSVGFALVGVGAASRLRD